MDYKFQGVPVWERPFSAVLYLFELCNTAVRHQTIQPIAE